MLDLARAEIEAQRPLVALELLESLHRQLPTEAEVQGVRGLAHLALDEDQEADNAFSKAMVLNPNYYLYPKERGLSRYRRKLDRRASQDLEKAEKLLSTASCQYALGLMALGAGEIDQGLQHLRQATSARSSVAKKAQRRLALMELPADPSRYIEITSSKDSSGTLNLRCRNLSPIDVGDLVVDVQSPGGLGPESRRLRLSDSSNQVNSGSFPPLSPPISVKYAGIYKACKSWNNGGKVPFKKP